MSIADRVLDWFDAPRFCPDDGEPIEVTSHPRFDPNTGGPHDSWYWHCPDVTFDDEGGAITWRQWGVSNVHAHGTGRPRWDAKVKRELG